MECGKSKLPVDLELCFKRKPAYSSPRFEMDWPRLVTVITYLVHLGRHANLIIIEALGLREDIQAFFPS